MSKKGQTIASVALSSDEPTELNISDLYSWIIWQFPRKIDSGLCGAVRPPLAKHGWYPAEISHKSRRILVHGQISKTFESPAAAADWLTTNSSSEQ